MEILITLSLVYGIILVHRPIGDWLHRLYEKRQYRFFLAQETYYHSIVSRYLKYYNRLTLEEQRKFLFRTFLFKKSKRFHYTDVQERAEMPVLISAVAIQLTMGLDKYMLNYFKDIYVLKDDYHYGYYSRPFQGHVDHTGIYLSWDNFLKGVMSLTSNCNVGLHEMAHALTYVNFITETEEDRHFKKEFRNFSKIARPIYAALQHGHKSVLGDYAASNYHEFWAVSVEVFFENPVRLRHELPSLYGAMVRLLRQDPLALVTRKREEATRKIA